MKDASLGERTSDERSLVTLQTGSWCADSDVTLPFPRHWDITLHDMKRCDPLPPQRIAEKIAEVRSVLGRLDGPVDQRSVAIVVDDHSRPTPVSLILPVLLAELFSFGIQSKNIRILVAVGTHEFDDRRVLDRKLGEIPREVEVVVPDCRVSSQFVSRGKLAGGVPVRIHKAFGEADAKIAISGVYPHDEVSFSGGAKILIGIMALETISGIHRRHGLVQRGGDVDTAFRQDLESVADMVGLDFSINCVVNQEKQVAALHCGRFREALRAAVVDARKHFGTTPDPDADVIIANAYPMDTALCVLGKSRWCFRHGRSGSHKILVTALCDCPLGRVQLATSRTERLVQAVKRMSGASSARSYIRKRRRLRELERHRNRRWESGYVVYVPFIEDSVRQRPNLIDGMPVAYDWGVLVSELLEALGQTSRVKVSIYSCAPMLFPSGSGRGPTAIG